MKLNSNFQNLHESYLFVTVARKTAAYQKLHPDRELIKLSIGDVTLPLAPVVIEAMSRAVNDMANPKTFKGYAPDRFGYAYEGLIDAIKGHYARRDVSLNSEEIFVSDGAKSDLANILDLFSSDNVVLLSDQGYPAYADSNIMAGRHIVYAKANAKNDFLPMPDSCLAADIIYLCSPNNPTGAAYTRSQLKEWVNFALEKNAVILYDAAYEAFVQDDTLAQSIYEVEDAKECAIEICSFSKTAGFTGVRCGYTIVPQKLVRERMSLNRMWMRRQSTKFNGVSYITQMGAAAAFSEEGERQIRKNIEYYRENAKNIAECLERLEISYTGGKNSPYIWMKCPNGMDSWSFFDYLLEKANVVGTPGCGFGSGGEGYFRLTAFNTKENTERACSRMERLLTE